MPNQRHVTRLPTSYATRLQSFTICCRFSRSRSALRPRSFRASRVIPSDSRATPRYRESPCPALLCLPFDASTLMSTLTCERKDIERALAFCAVRATEKRPPATLRPDNN